MSLPNPTLNELLDLHFRIVFCGNRDLSDSGINQLRHSARIIVSELSERLYSTVASQGTSVVVDYCVATARGADEIFADAVLEATQQTPPSIYLIEMWGAETGVDWPERLTKTMAARGVEVRTRDVEDDSTTSSLKRYEAAARLLVFDADLLVAIADIADVVSRLRAGEVRPGSTVRHIELALHARVPVILLHPETGDFCALGFSPSQDVLRRGSVYDALDTYIRHRLGFRVAARSVVVRATDSSFREIVHQEPKAFSDVATPIEVIYRSASRATLSWAREYARTKSCVIALGGVTVILGVLSVAFNGISLPCSLAESALLLAVLFLVRRTERRQVTVRYREARMTAEVARWLRAAHGFNGYGGRWNAEVLQAIFRVLADGSRRTSKRFAGPAAHQVVNNFIDKQIAFHRGDREKNLSRIERQVLLVAEILVLISFFCVVLGLALKPVLPEVAVLVKLLAVILPLAAGVFTALRGAFSVRERLAESEYVLHRLDHLRQGGSTYGDQASVDSALNRYDDVGDITNGDLDRWYVRAQNTKLGIE